MNIHDKIKAAYGARPSHEIAKKMGYGKMNIAKGEKRIEKIVKDPNLGLAGGDYDGVFSSIAFIQKLLDVMGIDDEECQKDIDDIQDAIHDEQFGYQPWMFVETDFKYVSQPIHVLACLEGKRRIRIGKDIKRLPRDKQITRLSEKIRLHQKSLKKTGGKIEMWGTPKKYICHIGENDIVEMTTGGEVISEIEHEVFHDKVTLSLRWRD